MGTLQVRVPSRVVYTFSTVPAEEADGSMAWTYLWLAEQPAEPMPETSTDHRRAPFEVETPNSAGDAVPGSVSRVYRTNTAISSSTHRSATRPRSVQRGMPVLLSSIEIACVWRASSWSTYTLPTSSNVGTPVVVHARSPAAVPGHRMLRG